MQEYFVTGWSRPAPIFGDVVSGYVMAGSPSEALLTFAYTCEHPAGVFSARVFASADDYHKSREPLAQWPVKRLRAAADAA